MHRKPVSHTASPRLSVALRAVPAASLLFLALAGRAHAGPYEDGMAALDRWDTVRATAYFEQAAQQGDPRGLLELATLVRRVDQSMVDLLERAAALGEPRAKHHLAELQLRDGTGGERTGPRFVDGPERIPTLLASACENQVSAACGELAGLYAGDLKEFSVRAGIREPDVARAKHWGERWRAGRLREADKGNIAAITDLVIGGSRAWSGIDADALAFHRMVLDDLNGDGASEASKEDPALRKRVDAWEIARGLRPAQLPAATKLAAGIATFEAADEFEDAEVIAAAGRHHAASTLAAYRYGSDMERAWGPALGKATAVATRDVEAVIRRVAGLRKTHGLDTQTWLARRLVATFTPMQLHSLARVQATEGARKRALLSRTLRTASVDGGAVVLRLGKDPGMRSLGADVPERTARYARDRGIDVAPSSPDPLVAERERLFAYLLARLERAPDLYEAPVATARLGHAAWMRAAALVRRGEAAEISATLFCGPCRRMTGLMRELAAEVHRFEPVRTALEESRARTPASFEKAGIVLERR